MATSDWDAANWLEYAAQARTYSRIDVGLRALLKARVRCLSVDDILRRLEANPIVSYQQRELLFLRLRDLEWRELDRDRLRALLMRIELEGESSKSRPGARITGLIKEILKLLPNNERVDHCMRYLSHRHVHRRTMACALLRDASLGENVANEICEMAADRDDWPLLRLAALKADAANIEHLITYVLPHLGDPYWESRVIEKIIDRTSDDVVGQLAAEFPLGFLWAIARLRDRQRLPVVTPHIATIDWHWLPVVAWALGTLAASSELDALEGRLRQSDLWGQYLEFTQGAAPYFLQSPSSQWPRWDILVEQGSRRAVETHDGQSVNC